MVGWGEDDVIEFFLEGGAGIYFCSLLDNIVLRLASFISRHVMLITVKSTLTKKYIIRWCRWNMINLWL